MKFPKDQIIQTVRQNREAHRAIFEEALEGYRDKVVESLNAHLERIKRGEVLAISVHYPQPEDHTRDYDRLLEMLKLTTDGDVELSETQFAQYMQDDWTWKRQFITTNAAYSKTADELRKEL